MTPMGRGRCSSIFIPSKSRVAVVMVLICLFYDVDHVLAARKCSGRWAVHACGGGNGKRSSSSFAIHRRLVFPSLARSPTEVALKRSDRLQLDAIPYIGGSGSSTSVKHFSPPDVVDQLSNAPLMDADPALSNSRNVDSSEDKNIDEELQTQGKHYHRNQRMWKKLVVAMSRKPAAELDRPTGS